MPKYDSKNIQSVLNYTKAESVRLDAEMAIVTLTGDLYHVMTLESAKNLGVEVVGVVTPMAMAMNRCRR